MNNYRKAIMMKNIWAATPVWAETLKEMQDPLKKARRTRKGNGPPAAAGGAAVEVVMTARRNHAHQADAEK
jgi:hypothetical protein